MAKDPATTRIPRLDGMSRIPPPGSFGGTTSTTSHIRPPTATATALKSTTQIFHAPALPSASKRRPISSYHPTVTPLHDLGANIKKSASGERLNNAVSLISKRTTTVLKKYFGQAKIGTGSATPSQLMISSLPQTPLPAAKQQQQQQLQQSQQLQQQLQLTSSTPMPLMRSETFVCDEETSEKEQQTPIAQRINLESTRLSSVGFGRTLDMDSTMNVSNKTSSMNRTRPVVDRTRTQTAAGEEHDRTRTVMTATEEPNRTRTVMATAGEECDRTRTVQAAVEEPDRTRTLHAAGEEHDRTLTEMTAGSDATQVLVGSSCGRDRTRPVIQTTELSAQSLDLTKSMDQLPLLEHMSIPSGLDMLSAQSELEEQQASSELVADLDVTLTALAPDKTNMKLPLNSTINTERLLDISGLQSPARHIQLLNLTREFLEQSPPRLSSAATAAGGGGSGRRSIGQQSLVCLTPQSATTTPLGARFQNTPVPVHLLSPLLKAARSDLVLPTRTPDGELPHLDGALAGVVHCSAMRNAPRTRYSFGLELQESTLDASIELVDDSFSASQQQLQQLQQQLFKKQHSFDLDESLGILTPDQMKEFLDSSSQHNQSHQQLELQLAAVQQHHQQQLQHQHQLQQQQQHLQLQQQLRMEQTPSPEELPLDPIEPQLVSAIAIAPLVQATAAVTTTTAATAAASTNAKQLSNSFITSVTSVTSLDTGYQGDGEMSRPASRGACDHSPSNGPHLGRVSRQPSFPPMPAAPMRRQDPMTDSDFFTESDADDVLQRGDRRAQVIDGQLYGPAAGMQPSASVPQLEDSCMESSGIFTDVENRCDEEMRLPELEVDVDDVGDVDVDMSPDDSTQTMRKAQGQAQSVNQQQQQSLHNTTLQQQRPLSSSSAATLSLSNRTSYCSVDGGSAKSFCDEAFSSNSSSCAGSEQRSSAALSVQRAASPRQQHVDSSLTSLCTVENLSSSSSLAASPKATKIKTTTVTTTTSAAGKASPIQATKTTTPRSAKTQNARKSHTPNKWDAVMHKIASNKSTIKTNYSDVKSKVSTTRAANMAGPPNGATAATSGNATNTSNSPTSSGSPRITPSVRRSPSVTPSIVKRSSVNSNSSSKSPSSATTTPASTSTRQPQDKGSVGAGVSVFTRLAKSPTSPTASSAAKRLQPVLIKRGRSYSKDSQKSSHSDLSSLCNGSGSPKLLAKTPLRAAKKRDVRNLSISPTDLGPPPKTQQTTKGQSTRTKSTTPTPTTIQKRLNSTAPSSTSISTNSSIVKGAIKATAQSKQQQNAKNNATLKNSSKPLDVNISEESLRSGVDQTELQELNELGLILATPRDSKRASISNEVLCICGAADTKNATCSCATEKAPKLQRTQDSRESSCALETEQTEAQLKELTASLPTTNEDTSLHSQAEENPLLKCFMENGYLNYERLTKCLEGRKQQQEQQQCQLMGLAIVVQCMSKQMDKLSCQDKKSQTTLAETIAMLQQTQRNCEELQQQLHDKDVEWTQRQQELEHLQRSKLQEAQDKVQEVQLLAKERFLELESQLQAKDEEKKQALQAYHQEMAHQLRHKQDQLNAAEQQVLQLQTRIRDHEAQEQVLREKLTRKENTHVRSMSAATQREEEALERVKELGKELQSLRTSTELKERDLRDRLALSQDEVSVLRTSSQRRSPSNHSNSNGSHSNSLNDSSGELCRLTNEAESLRCVLELKQAEISTLSKQNAELQRENDEQRSLSNRVTLLEAQNEMMRTELESKTEKEKEIQRQMEEMQKAFNHESIKRKRLTCDKEELQYHLKQRSEQLVLVQAQLHELSNCSHDSSINSHSYSRSNSMRADTSNTSPPASPVIKGVIERNDSVSWVLEMDDESPQVAASKLVRRAGSLRSTCERSPTQRRQPQLSQSFASNGHTNGHGHGSISHVQGPNPLSQSMSATALMRGQTNEPESPRPLCRARSQSVCNNKAAATAFEMRPQRQQQQQRQRQRCDDVEAPLSDWQVDELRSSSPQPLPPPVLAEMRPRSSSAMKLITCDAYPKALNKKFQEIQESAGEAMVSGANSEDESCSASSEDMRSSSASSTASAAGCSLSKRQKQPSRMSIEEALLLDQVNSLNGTPMEVSWSEDAADADAANNGHSSIA
ncbi:serine-rich adhesin for platelets [Drosophila albomicans]|uniref:Serine-rich adhesin for platelets n=1 Tax=Drosophila albomicans TaxID=7291 RepID=A0A6P8XNL8_DROAB|nr:serine-rich adhesin for platelets [Drosophila albomicans]